MASVHPLPWHFGMGRESKSECAILPRNLTVTRHTPAGAGGTGAAAHPCEIRVHSMPPNAGRGPPDPSPQVGTWSWGSRLRAGGLARLGRRRPRRRGAHARRTRARIIHARERARPPQTRVRCTHAHTRTYTHAHTHIHARTHAHTHAHTNAF